jgi:hypothetical protein
MQAPVTFDLEITWSGQQSRPWTICHSLEDAKRRLEKLWDEDLEIQKAAIHRVTHKHYCGVTAVACTCGGVSKELALGFESGPLRWQARDEARAVRARARENKAALGLVSGPRSRLSPLAAF